MSTKIDPWLGRSRVMHHSFANCISNTSKKLSRTTEMSLSEIISQPVMPPQKSKSGIIFKQPENFANTYRDWYFDEQMRMVYSNTQLIDSKVRSFSNFSNNVFTNNSNVLELERMPIIFWLPNKVEGILPEGVFRALQIHFFASANSTRNLVHAKFNSGAQQSSGHIYNLQELNVKGSNFSSCPKARVSLPLM